MLKQCCAVVLLVFVAACSVPRLMGGEKPAPHERRIAITFDDLPVGGDNVFRLDKAHDINARIIRTLLEQKVPAVGFVSEARLAKWSREQANAQAGLLEQWIVAGIELGNHTYAHASYRGTEEHYLRASTMQQDALLRARLPSGIPLRFFRYPDNSESGDIEEKASFETFLKQHGYTVAPVTLDTSDAFFSEIYTFEGGHNDVRSMSLMVSDYLIYTEQIAKFYEKMSVEAFGREIPQVMVLHVNEINAVMLPEVLKIFRKRGYKFVRLEEALQDPAYQTPDMCTGSAQLRWIQCCALAKGIKPARVPEFPAWTRQFRITDGVVTW